MKLTVVTPPPFEPVTLQEVYAHLRLDTFSEGSPPEEPSHPDDAMLLAQIAAAREFVESATRRSLVQRTLRLSFGAWPGRWCWVPPSSQAIKLLRPPFVRLVRVAYYGSDNVLVDVDPADYYVCDDLVPELRFTGGFGWPSLYGRPDALRVDYVAGYPAAGSPPETQADYAANIPASLKQAILATVQLTYDNLSPPDREALERMREATLLQPSRIQLLL